MSRFFLFLLLLALGVASCGGGDPSPASSESVPAPVGEDHDDDHDDEIEIPETVQRNLGLTFARVEARHVAQTLRVPGSFELRPLARREHRMELPGRVELLVDQYDEVEEGQVLYRFQSPAWPELLHEIILGEQEIATASAQIVVARASLDEARGRLDVVRERVEALARADVKRADLAAEAVEIEASIPRLEAEIELARTRLANAERTRDHALHRASTAADIPEDVLVEPIPSNEPGGRSRPRYETLDWIEVRAPRRGVVEALRITDGAFVEPTRVVLSTVDLEQVRFRALALQSDLPRLEAATTARIVPARPATGAAGEDDGIGAELSFSLEAHPRERTLSLLATPERTAPWIRPGVSAFLEIVLDESAPGALAIPASAVVQDGLEHVFFLRDREEPDHAVRVVAELGASDGRWVAIEAGVELGDEVVVAGAYELTLAMRQGGAGESSGHVHADGTTHADH